MCNFASSNHFGKFTVTCHIHPLPDDIISTSLKSDLILGKEWNILICGMPFSVVIMQQLVFGPPCILIVKIAAVKFVFSLCMHRV